MNQQMQDLENERRRGTFPVRKMTFLLNGGERETLRLEKLKRILEEDPIFDRTDDYFMSNEEKYKVALERFKRIQELKVQGKLQDLSEAELLNLQRMGAGFHAISLHFFMFLPTLRGQADEEQLKELLPLAESFQMIGCYAQTELGHGSNVRGIETTATFDREKDSFILHSPTLTSTKWWPGALGKTANHAVVYARLLLPKGSSSSSSSSSCSSDFEDKGVHPFLLRIRDQETHQNMPGVKTGFIGPRYGTHSNDNGFLRMDHVQIPRRNMLMRYTRVERDGTYKIVNPKAAKLNYGTMLFVRASIVEEAGINLSLGCTITTRYSCVRRQFPSEEEQKEKEKEKEGGKGLEMKILDYQSQQYRVLPYLATSYALIAAGKRMKKMYNDLQKGIGGNNLEALPEAHATSSGLKAVTTMLASEGIEELRKACGGHGFLMNSGLGDLFTSYVSNNTLEGENYVIIQQLSRYLVKAFKGAQKGTSPPGNAKYLLGIAKNQYLPVDISQPSDLLKPENQLNSFANRAGYLISETSKRMDQELSEGRSFAAALQKVQWMSTRASKAHCMFTILLSFVEMTQEVQKTQPELYQPLKNLCDLFALYHLERELGDFLEASQFSPKQSGWIHSETENALKRVRPEAVALVDAFNHFDRDLNSALGRYDGNVYEALYNWTQRDPMNKEDVIWCYKDVIRPIVKNDFPSKL